MLHGHVRAGVRAVVAARRAVDASTWSCCRPTSTASPRRWRSPSSTTRRWRRPASSASSTARSRSRPDGNPLVGPIRGIRNCWVACAVMAGLSQGGGVGLALANWMTTGDPQLDIWGMDVARFGDWANLAYTNAKVRENYSRRFRITFPNEELPAGRPLHTTPVYDRLTEHNAVWGAGFGLEHPLWFQRAGLEPVEEVTFRRSNAFPVVAEECRAVRERVGLTECSNFAKYRVTGDGAAELAAGPVHEPPAEGRTDRPDGDAQPRRPHRRRVLRRPRRRRRLLPVRVAGRRGAPPPLVPRPPAAPARRSASTCSACRSSGCRSPGRTPATCCSR